MRRGIALTITAAMFAALVGALITSAMLPGGSALQGTQAAVIWYVAGGITLAVLIVFALRMRAIFARAEAPASRASTPTAAQHS